MNHPAPSNALPHAAPNAGPTAALRIGVAKSPAITRAGPHRVCAPHRSIETEKAIQPSVKAAKATSEPRSKGLIPSAASRAASVSGAPSAAPGLGSLDRRTRSIARLPRRPRSAGRAHRRAPPRRRAGAPARDRRACAGRSRSHRHRARSGRPTRCRRDRALLIPSAGLRAGGLPAFLTFNMMHTRYDR